MVFHDGHAAGSGFIDGGTGKRTGPAAEAGQGPGEELVSVIVAEAHEVEIRLADDVVGADVELIVGHLALGIETIVARQARKIGQRIKC